jgi:hypothetical protein
MFHVTCGLLRRIFGSPTDSLLKTIKWKYGAVLLARLTMSMVWLIGPSRGFADADAPTLPIKIPVLVIKYFPVKGDRIDLAVTGDWGASLKDTRLKTDKQTKAAIDALQEASRYHGYKDSEAQPSLVYEVVDEIEFLEPMPTIPRPGHRVPLTDYKRIMERVEINFDYALQKKMTLVEGPGHNP